MTIKLNNQYHDIVEGTSLMSFIESLGLKTDGIAIAINFEVVPKAMWSKTILTDKLELMLIHAVSGG
ncbi:sulfur carrier protein ThiS [Dysgonomonas sp. Marseille-P4677]|uniref:sulfur carrier protein ThiS n=1 Tax=Dysgonomonas sp. Marseille-P4677 TaxID=2364790 RepID=UPI001913EEBD|nr:sulfur carrier protein ThiS [Dysgonomonas sp. Marseille-P4677]MBK5720638.1 sulfur carrier protein ThiS [Dysgonomonas sp. Marseille-P4677]